MPFEIAFLLGLIVLNGLLAMSEIALVTARRGRLQTLIEQGDSGAAAALALNGDPTRFLSTIQVGITTIGILSGIVGEAALGAPLGDWLIRLGMDMEYAHLGATALVVVLVTYVSIVIGELVPKRLGQMFAEGVARRVARPVGWLATTAHPFVRLLSASTDLVLRLVGASGTAASKVTEEEIQQLIKEGSESGVIDEQERAMVRNVFRLDDRQIASLMTPRSDIVYLDLKDGRDVNLRKVLESGRSRFPVCRGGLREIIGIASARQLLQQTIRGEAADFASGLEAAIYVPESLTGMELLENFRTSTSHLALVVDEYGELQGLVTLHDLFVSIAGEFKTHHDEDAWAVQRGDGSWLLDGMIPIPELKDRLGFNAAPDEELGRYNTLSGMLMLLLGRVPSVGDAADWQGWRFEVVDMDNHRIDKVLAARLPESSAATDGLPPG
jgi:magnesium and cobalt exporter, CNNM family